MSVLAQKTAKLPCLEETRGNSSQRGKIRNGNELTNEHKDAVMIDRQAHF